MMQFVRDSDAVGAILAGAGSRPAEELVTALRKGGYLRKYGRYGKPKQHWFRLSHDDKELLWDSSNGKIRSVPLLSVHQIIQGQTTPVFKRDPLPEFESVSFSLLYSEGKGTAKERSLDLVCRTTQEFETWFLGIQLVIVLNQNVALQQQQQLQLQAAVNGQEASAVRMTSSASGSATPLRKHSSGPLATHKSDDKLQEFKQIAASLQQPVKAALTGSSQRSSSREFVLPAKREIGDCYIWGSWSDAEAAGMDVSEGALQMCGAPTMVANTHALDVIQVAVGAYHAALMTRGGEVYTWGAGLGGIMGNGTACGSNHPQQVTRLAGKGTTAVACGHSYTAAVLADGSLYTWGTGLGGQLGLGPHVTCAVWPARICAGLQGVRVSQVSCGPYHAAAIGSDGRLFTWGDGLFGKLGHGDHCSAHSPRFVTTLAEHWVISVSCGWWHTAAAAVARARLTGRGTASSTSLDSYVSDAESLTASTDGAGAPVRRTTSNSGGFLRGNIVRSSGSVSPATLGLPPIHPSSSFGAGAAAAAAATAADVHESPAATATALASQAADMGGAIFTWGGDFKWSQPGSKDHHQGCLGVGDLSGRLVPTLVKGEDNHVQVACGLNFTVALTTNGEVYQMGSTGAQNNREKDKADWKGALVPVLVRGQLSNHSAQRLACGMSHVAVIATQRVKANSSSGSTPMTRLLTWGKNTAGQLGIGAGREDHHLPQEVKTVAKRRILFLACGGSYTLAVCEHDPQIRWSRDSLDEGLAATPSGLVITSSGPSRMHLPGGPLTAGGSSGTPGGGLTPAAASGGTLTAVINGLQGAQRAAGTGGLTVSASLSSLASSVQSAGRGDASGAGSGGGNGSSGLARKSDRGRLESRYSDRGLSLHAAHSAREQQHHQQQQQPQQQPPPSASKSMGLLTRSLDRSLGGLGFSVGGAAAAAGSHRSNQQQGQGSSHVSWAPGPGAEGSNSRSLLRSMGHSSKGLVLSFSSGPSLSTGAGQGAGLQLQDLSLQALASASKRGHLPLPKSFKRLASRGRSDSNNSSSARHATWADWQSQGPGHTKGPGTVAATAAAGSSGTPREQWASAGRTSSRQLSYSARSEPDLATVSATSSMASAALTMTPSPSIHSMQEGRAAEAMLEGQEGGGDFQRQLRYWQERATNMEQQLSRRTHELENLRRELRFSSTSQGTNASNSVHHYSSLRPQDSSSDGAHRRSSGGGAGAPVSHSHSSSTLAVRRGLQPLPPVAPGVRMGTPDGGSSGSSDVTAGQSTGSSSVSPAGPLTGSTAATTLSETTPSAASSAGAPAAAAAAAVGARLHTLHEVSQQDSFSSQQQQQQQQQQEVPGVGLGSYPLPDGSPGRHSGRSSPTSSSMQDAREDWGSPGSAEPLGFAEDVLERNLPLEGRAPSLSLSAAVAGAGEADVASTVPLESEAAVSFIGTIHTSNNSATQGSGAGGPLGLLRGTSLANWIAEDGARVALLRSPAASLANGSSTGAASGAGAGEGEGPLQQQQQQQQQQQAVSSANGSTLQQQGPRRSSRESFVFSAVQRLQAQQEQQQEQQRQRQEQQRQQRQGLTELEALQEAGPGSDEESSFAADSSMEGRRRTKQQQQHDMFRGMSEHSKEASRVLALFQQSQLARQQLEQQQLEQQQQAGMATPPLPGSGNAGRGPNADSTQTEADLPASSAVSPSAAAAAAGGRDGRDGSTAGAAAADAAASAGGELSLNGTRASGPVLPPGVDASQYCSPSAAAAAAAAGSGVRVASLSPAALRELEQLREQNRLLQQQLQELRQQQQRAPVVSVLPAPVVGPGRSSLGSVGPTTGGLGGMLGKHRKTVSVDIGSYSHITHEVSKGVYLSLQALPQGGYELKRVRFAKQMFSSEDAEQWWTANRDQIYAAYNISQQHPPASWQQQATSQQQQQGQQSPEPQQAGGAGATGGGGSSSSAGRVLVSLASPHPLGRLLPAYSHQQDSSNCASRGPAMEEVTGRPPGSSGCLNSPLGSTLELDALQLPPNALLSATGTPAGSEAGQGPAAQQQQQQQQAPRGWSAVLPTSDAPQVTRSSSLGPGLSVPIGLTPRSNSLGAVGIEVVYAGSAAGGRSGSIHQHTSSRLSQTSLLQLGDTHGDAALLHSATGSPVLAVSPQPQSAGILSSAPGSNSTAGGAAGCASGAMTSPIGGLGGGPEGYSSSSGVAWQPVLPRKASLAAATAAGGASATGSSADAAAAVPGGLSVVPAAASVSSGHKRTGSGLFRWLSKAAEGNSSNGSLQ